MLADVLGRELSCVDAPPDVLPAAYAEAMSTTRVEDVSVLSDDIAHVLGRPPRTYATWARDCFPGFAST